MSDRPLRILGIVGSLGSGSYNRALLAPRKSLPEGMIIEVFDLLTRTRSTHDYTSHSLRYPLGRA